MKKTIKITILTIAALFVFAGVANTSTIQAEAASKTTTSTSARKTKKVVKLKKEAKTKTTKKVKTKKSTRKYSQNNAAITKVTTVKTTTVTKFKAKKKTINTTIQTTIKTTTTPKATTAASNTNSSTTTRTTTAASSQKLTIDDLNGTVDPLVIKAFKTMNYEIVINGSVSYAGYFDGKNQRITLRSANKEYLLHELGHYVSFITGFKDSTAEFKSIYNSEASKFTGSNKAYVTQNSEEYFAESFRDFYTRPATLKSARPATYAYIEKCIDSITDSRINYINAIYYAQ